MAFEVSKRPSKIGIQMLKENGDEHNGQDEGEANLVTTTLRQRESRNLPHLL